MAKTGIAESEEAFAFDRYHMIFYNDNTKTI